MKRKILQSVFSIMLTVMFCQSLSAQIPDKLNGMVVDRPSLWSRDSDGVTRISVCWENPGNYSTEIELVKQAVAETWEDVANLKFTGWGTCYSNSKGIRINIKDGHPHTKGLGNKLDGLPNGMELNFTFNNFSCYRTKEQCIKWIASHEFGHAIGIAHEHNRTDCRCEEPPQGSDGGYYVTECDKNSIMNYCNPNWTNLGKLSQLDIKGAKIIYGEKKTTSSRVTATFEDSLGEGQTYENLFLIIDNKAFAFHVNTQSQTDRGYIYFPKQGSYDYFLYSKTLFGDQWRVLQGSGTIDIEDGKNYEFILNESGQLGVKEK